MMKKERRIISVAARLGMKVSLSMADIMIAPLCSLWIFEPEEPVEMKTRLAEMKWERK